MGATRCPLNPQCPQSLPLLQRAVTSLTIALDEAVIRANVLALPTFIHVHHRRFHLLPMLGNCRVAFAHGLIDTLLHGWRRLFPLIRLGL
jgi:hypothetical protein